MEIDINDMAALTRNNLVSGDFLKAMQDHGDFHFTNKESIRRETVSFYLKIVIASFFFVVSVIVLMVDKSGICNVKDVEFFYKVCLGSLGFLVGHFMH